MKKILLVSVATAAILHAGEFERQDARVGIGFGAGENSGVNADLILNLRPQDNGFAARVEGDLGTYKHSYNLGAAALGGWQLGNIDLDFGAVRILPIGLGLYYTHVKDGGSLSGLSYNAAIEYERGSFFLNELTLEAGARYQKILFSSNKDMGKPSTLYFDAGLKYQFTPSVFGAVRLGVSNTKVSDWDTNFNTRFYIGCKY